MEITRYQIEDDPESTTITFAGREAEIHTTDDTVVVSKAAGVKALREMRKLAKDMGQTVSERRWEQGADEPWQMEHWD